MFEEQILAQCRNGTVSGASKLLREHDTRIWRVLRYYVNECKKKAVYRGVTNIGIDEKSKRGHNYLTLFVNLDSRKVMYIAEGKDKQTVKDFCKDFRAHKGDPKKVKNVTCDMSLTFEKAIAECMPNAIIITDKFHVIKHFNDKINKTLRDDIKAGHALKRTKWIWMKNRENLTERQQETFDSISTKKTKTARAYQMKLAMQEIYQMIDKTQAEIELKRLIRWMQLSRIDHMRTLAKTLKNHFNNILHYFDARLTNAILEGTNNIAENIKTNSRGFRNDEYYKTMIYFYCGDFEVSVNSVHPH
jgi:transposase